MTVPRDDVPLEDLAEQQRDLDEAAGPEDDQPVPDRQVPGSAADADEGDLLEQSMPVGDGDDDYPYGTDEQ